MASYDTYYTVHVKYAGEGGTAHATPSRARSGEYIELTARPDYGYELSGWVGAGIIINNNTFRMPAQNVYITAVFKKKEYNLTARVGPEAGGTFSNVPEKAAWDTLIEPRLTVNQGYTLTEIRMNDVWFSSHAEASFRMPMNDVALQANLDRIPYKVNLMQAEGGTAELTVSAASGGEDYSVRKTARIGDTLNLSARAANGFYFKEWDINGNKVTDNRYTMPPEEITITPVFGRNKYRIHPDYEPKSDAGRITNELEVEYGTKVTPTQTPAAGYTFVKWQLDRQDLSGDFTMPASDVQLKAIYRLTEFTVTIGSASNGSGSASKTKATMGEQITLTASPAAGYQLARWEATPNSLSVTGNYSFTMPPSNVTVTPVFTKKSFNINKVIAPPGTGNITSPAGSSALYNEEVTVAGAAETGWYLQGWSTKPVIEIKNKKFNMPAFDIQLWAIFEKLNYPITKVCSPEAGGSITAPTTAQMGDSVPVSATANTGYTFKRWELSSGNVVGGKFTMPPDAMTVTAYFDRNSYQITARVSPAGAGVVTVDGTALYNDQVSVSQTPATGYYFIGWELSTGGSVTNGKFTMPASAVTVTARYLRRSTCSLNKNTLQGGEKVTMSIVSEDAAYTHQYKISFGTNMETGWADVAARVNSLEITIPTGWANAIPDSQTKAGGTVSIRTYKGNTLIGTYEAGGLTYQVPADANPSPTGIGVTPLLTVDGVSYTDVSGNFVQNRCGAVIQAPGSEAKYGASITSIRIRAEGYSGSRYEKFILASSGSFETGILTRSGETTFTIEATDSRGLTGSLSQTVNVLAYAPPMITDLQCWRTDTDGNADEMGEYAQYSFNYTWDSGLPGNEVHTRLESQGVRVDDGAKSGWLIGEKRSYSITLSHEITLSVWDIYGEVGKSTLTFRIESGKFILHFAADGKSVAIGHAVSHTAGQGYGGTFEIDDDLEIWIGNRTLKEYILAVISGEI